MQFQTRRISVKMLVFVTVAFCLEPHTKDVCKAKYQQPLDTHGQAPLGLEPLGSDKIDCVAYTVHNVNRH
jgi:hypothetical protein